MGKATNIKAWDTHISSQRPDRNYGFYQKLGVWAQHAANGQSMAYMSFARPFPLKARIIKATLTFRTYEIAQAGDHAIGLRRVADKFAFGRVTWATKPDVVTTGSIAQTKTGALPAGTEWSFDVTTDMQKVSDGAPWYGWRVTCNDPLPRWIFSSDNTYGQPGPRLTVEWSDAPDEPASLSPNEGVVGRSKPALSFEYTPIDEDATLQKVHVQTSATPSFTSPSWDSGQQDWTEPTVYPGDLGYPGAAIGAKVYWRVRVMDQGGWSRWSSIAWFTHFPEPGITLTSPTLASPYISQQTPQISWESPGQVAYHVTVARANSGYGADEWLWSSGRVTSSANSLEIPLGVISRDKIPYRIIVRAYDSKQRIAVANDPYTYSGVSVDVTFTTNPALKKVTDVVATQVPNSPDVKITWKRATSADQYQIIRDGINDLDSPRRVFVETVDHDDVVQSDGSFAYIDHGAPPQTPIRYSIYPVMGPYRGEGTLSRAFQSRLDGIWLVMPTFSVMIAGDDQGTWELPENATAHQVVGASAPTVIREADAGYQGSLSGVLVDEERYQPGISAQMKRDRFLAIKNDPRNARLVVADMNIPVRLANLNVFPSPHSNLRFECSFDFWQTDELWVDRL